MLWRIWGFTALLQIFFWTVGEPDCFEGIGSSLFLVSCVLGFLAINSGVEPPAADPFLFLKADKGKAEEGPRIQEPKGVVEGGDKDTVAPVTPPSAALEEVAPEDAVTPKPRRRRHPRLSRRCDTPPPVQQKPLENSLPGVASEGSSGSVD